MRIKTKNYEHVGGQSGQHSSNEQPAENDNHTEESQHAPAPIPPNIRITMTQETIVINGSERTKRK
jgi:hypothetical protein